MGSPSRRRLPTRCERGGSFPAPVVSCQATALSPGAALDAPPARIKASVARRTGGGREGLAAHRQRQTAAAAATMPVRDTKRMATAGPFNHTDVVISTSAVKSERQGPDVRRESKRVDRNTPLSTVVLSSHGRTRR
jgi:hypothetical protein